MAKTRLNLHAYQQDILERLQRVKETAEQTQTSKLGVRVGGANWLVSMSDIAEALPVPEMTAVPLTLPWFLGVANVRGNLFGISDLAAMHDGGLTKLTRDTRILLVHERFESNVALLVSQLTGLRNVSEMQRIEPPKEKPVWLLARYQDKNGEVWDEFDVRTLLNEQSFMHIAA